MRVYSDIASDRARSLLAALITHSGTAEYRNLMVQLGQELALILVNSIDRSERVMVVCTNEDADFLANGLLSTLDVFHYSHLGLACFWNDRISVSDDLDIAPIIKSYIEPFDKIDVLIVVKSIISTGCVVHAVISELVGDRSPERILIVAPVVYHKARRDLDKNFDRGIAEKIQYLWLAEDDERKADGQVVPGIGGSIYELLGVGNSRTKNEFIPEIVKQRRLRYQRS